MAAELVIAPEAQQDLQDAYSWYEERRRGLGEEFLGCVDASIQTLCRMPDLHPKVHEEYRRALVRRFPHKTTSTSGRIEKHASDTCRGRSQTCG